MSKIVVVSNGEGKAVKLKVSDKVAACLTGKNVTATIISGENVQLSSEEQAVQMVKDHAKAKDIPFTEAAAELAATGKLDAYQGDRAATPTATTEEYGSRSTEGGRNFTHEQVVELSKERGVSYGAAASELSRRAG